MAYFHVQYPSRALNGEGEFLVFLPERGPRPYRVLWLLHGAFGEAYGSIWESSIVRYAQKRGMAVIAPSSYMGVYTDMVYGEASYSLVKEVFEVAPKLVQGLSDKREDNYLVGISMGGHGSFKLALEKPDRFAAAAAFSSPIDMVFTMTLLEAGKHGGGHELYDAFGSSEAYRGTIGDTLNRAKELAEAGVEIPRLFIGWGDDEHAERECSRIGDIFKGLGIQVETRIGHGGHSFDTWEPMMEDVVDWLMKGGHVNGAD